MSSSVARPDVSPALARKVHIIGVGGSGMSAIAETLLSMGHKVSGSDAADSPTLARLQSLGAACWVGAAPQKISEVDFVARSTAVPDSDPEVLAAGGVGVPVFSRSQVLAAIAGQKRCLAVAGTHGKTTTSSFLGLGLEAAGMDPSWIIGGQLAGRAGGSRWGAGQDFVVEADESDGTFLDLGAYAGIVTNVERDHLEHYGGWSGLQAAFAQFVRDTAKRGPVVVCGDDPGAAALAANGSVISYGQRTDAQYRIENVDLHRFSARFEMVADTERIQVNLATTGAHNVSNAAGALALAHCLGADLEQAGAGLAGFTGVGRRFQHRGEVAGVTFVDDYAHLPTEVRAAIGAARAGKFQRVVAVFQPHRYSRTEEVGHEFAGAFDDADLLVLTDVFAAGEAPRPGIDGTLVLKAVQSGASSPPLHYLPQRTELAAELAGLLRPGDLCLTLGAGDVTEVATEVQELLG